MPKPISNEKRDTIVKHMQAGESKQDIAKWLLICERTVTRVYNKYLQTGTYKPEPLNCGRKPKVTNQTMQAIVEKIKQQPDITLNELIEAFDLKISQAALCKRLKKLGLTFKKRHSIQVNKNETTS
jgi:transposase